jgi:hypothetical protein
LDEPEQALKPLVEVHSQSLPPLEGAVPSIFLRF